MPEPVFFATAADLRAWFEANHDGAAELLIGFHRAGSGCPGVTRRDALDQALCFGWIDGVLRPIDDQSYCIRFTPRRNKRNWSLVNIKRARELIDEGLMHPAGLEAFEHRDEARAAASSYARNNPHFDPALERAFRANKRAWAFFETLPPSYRRTVTWWVMSARRDETRRKRLAVLMDYSDRGERMPLMTPPRRSAAGSADG